MAGSARNRLSWKGPFYGLSAEVEMAATCKRQSPGLSGQGTVDFL